MRPLALLPLLLPLLTACGKKEAAPVAAPPPAAAVVATAPPAAPAAAYLSALAAVENATAPTSMQGLFDQAETAQSALMEVTGGENGKALLETYDEPGFAALQQQVRGLKLHRGMDIYAQPDPAFFLALAKAHGQPADVAFFTQYAATWGADDVPVYLKLRAQPTPCVRFGEDRILPLYQGWRSFAAAHPEAYVRQTTQNLGDLEEALVLGTCACDGLESVRREQATFLAAYPDHPKAADIRARREQLAENPDALPVNCR